MSTEPSQEQPEPPISADWSNVVLRFDTAEEACEYLLAFGLKVEVLTPLALREMICALVRAMVERYDIRESTPSAALY